MGFVPWLQRDVTFSRARTVVQFFHTHCGTQPRVELVDTRGQKSGQILYLEAPKLLEQCLSMHGKISLNKCKFYVGVYGICMDGAWKGMERTAVVVWAESAVTQSPLCTFHTYDLVHRTQGLSSDLLPLGGGVCCLRAVSQS